nr:hypothetical protein [Tanacetum cinerariifolium]
MTTPFATFTIDSQMHNNIMAAGSRDHLPILATGRYAQWRSRFLRYIDTIPNGDALRKCILEGPYTLSTVVVLAVPVTENSSAVLEHTTVETLQAIYPENKAHYESEKEAIHLILTRIGDEIYSTVDACKIAQEIWEAIERLQLSESLNIQNVKTNLFWEFGKFTSNDGETMESYYIRFYKMMNEMIGNNLTVATIQVNVQFLQQLQPEWSRFVTIVKQQHKLDEVSYQKLFDILKQYQKEVNELRAKRIARNANPLALVAIAQSNQDPYYQTPKSHKPYTPTSKASILNRSHATTRNKGKEIATPNTPPSENDNQFAQFGNQRTMTVAGAKENVGSPVVQQIGIQCFNCKEFGHFAKECRKPKKVKDSMYHKEKMLLCKQAEQGVPLQVEQSDWLADTDEEIDKQELEVHYSYMAKIQEVPTADSGTILSLWNRNTCVVETDDSNVILDSPYMCDNDIQNEQNAVECDDERVALANLIANLKLDVDENKKIQKQLKKANASLTQELTKCKSILTKTSRTLGESNSIRDSCDPVCQIFRRPLILLKIVQLILFIIDSGCTKHMTSNISLLCNFIEKYLGTVHFGNDQFAPILGYGDLVQGNITINGVYYVEGLNYNLFSVGQFCNADLEVALWKSTLSHHNFDYINFLLKKDVVIGLPRLKYVKDQLCYSCEVNKAKRSSFKTKTIPSSKGRLNLLHMDLCGPMLVTNINGKKYILVIVDDYSRYTWTLFLSSKDEILEVLKDFLTMVQRNLQAPVITIRVDRGTEFLNKTLCALFKEEGIEHQTSTPRTPEQNGVVKRRNYTTIQSQQELDLLFGPLYDKFFNAGTSSVNKSSFPTNNYTQQNTLPSTNIHPTSEPSTLTNVHAEENKDNQAEDEFTNPFCTSIREVTESFSRNIEQVRGNLSKPVQTRRQLATVPEMCMFALTVSTVEPKTIKEAMVDSAWIEAMQEELHQFDRL